MHQSEAYENQIPVFSELVDLSNKMDGFRRYLADIYINNTDGSQYKLGDVMVKAGLADTMIR